MPLGAFNYTPAVTGQAIDALAKAKSGVPSASYQGAWVWEAALQLFYMDLVSIYGPAIDMFLMSGGVMFAPMPVAPVLAPPIILAQFAAKPKPSSVIIDGLVKTACLGAGGDTASIQPLGAKIWAEFLGQIGMDLIEIIPMAVANKLNMGMVSCPAAAMAAPVVSLMVPGPPMPPTIPFIPASLMGSFTGVFNKGALQGLAQQIDLKVKADCTGGDPNTVGAKVWQAFLDLFCPYLKMQTETLIRAFWLAGPHWMSPSGLPGLPLIPPIMIPTISGQVPGINM